MRDIIVTKEDIQTIIELLKKGKDVELRPKGDRILILEVTRHRRDKIDR